MTRPGVARAAFGMGSTTAVSRAFGFVRVLVIAAVLGTTFLGNTFQASNSVSNVLFELLAAGALSAVLVPTFVTLLDAGNAAEAERLSGRLLGLALLFLGPVTIAGMIASPWLARLLSTGAPTRTSRRNNAILRRSCCSSSSRRSCCTHGARLRPVCCTRDGASRSRRRRRSATPWSSSPACSRSAP